MDRYDFIRIGVVIAIVTAITYVAATVVWFYVSEFTTEIVVPPLKELGEKKAKANIVSLKGGIAGVLVSALCYLISKVSMSKKTYSNRVALTVSAITLVALAWVIIDARNYNVNLRAGYLSNMPHNQSLNVTPKIGAH